MTELTRRALLARAATLAAGVAVLSLPDTLYRLPWTRLAAAQTPEHVEATFVAAVEAITTRPDLPTARWVIHEFDRALPPLPTEVAVTAAVTAVLDAHTVQKAYGPTFAGATPDQRRDVLASMVTSDQPDIRQIANQLLPFCAYGHWSDASMDKPATPEGPKLARWATIDYPGPSHSYLDTYRDAGPRGFRPMTTFES